ncbi:MAG: hypothetical protein GY820_16925 [Gammaproteobacteria bacterium]|nr:hypothetical protein [Gammaproteobacteria bacterium]
MDIKKTMQQLENANAARLMLIEHIETLIDQGLDLLVYAFRYPVGELKIIKYQEQPVCKILFRGEVMVSVELKANPFDPYTVDTWTDGEFAEFIIDSDRHWWQSKRRWKNDDV